MKTAGPSNRPSLARQVPQADPATAITFASFRLDLHAGRLLRGNEPIPLRPKTWAVLQHLAERPGMLVTKSDLLDAVWPDLAVTESVLSKSIGELRVALGDSFKAPRLIETVQRRGFRFIAKASDEASDEWRVTSDERGDSQLGQLVTHHSSRVTPFVGRATELQKLAALFAKARAGERQVVFATGSAGIGKTALVEAFLDAEMTVSGFGSQVPGFRDDQPETRSQKPKSRAVWIARGRCVEQYEPREAYMPVIEALERLARRPDAGHLAVLLRRVAPTWLAQMPWLIGDDEAQALRQSLQAVRPERMLREFAALIETLTTDVPLVLVLEDLHWSDASTVDLLSVLAERRESARLLVIGTYRPADAVVYEHVLMRAVRTLHVRRHCVEIALSDLTEEAVQSYLQARFPGSDFPLALARLIHKHTDGNPLFMSAVVDQLLSRGAILYTAPGWELHAPPETIDLGVPDSVRLLIESQLAGLSPADRALLQAASVAGDTFTPLVVAAALGGEVADAEMRCEAFAHVQRFLRVAGYVEWPDGSGASRYAFTHELYRQVVYAEIPERHCMRLHQRIGEALEAAYGARQMDIAPQLAEHFARGRDDARALRYLTAAAAGARQRFASREAIGYLDAALALVALLPDGDERRRREIELRLSLGAARSDVHGFASEPVRENYERASDLCAGVGNTTQLFAILYGRWYLHGMRAEADETMGLAAQIQKLARRLGASERVLADSALVRTAVYAARFADAVDLMRRRLTRRRRRKPTAAAVVYGVDPLIVAASHSAIALWFLGDPERALASARAAVAQARECGDFFTLCAVLMQAALVALLCRSTVEGADLAEQAVSLSAAHGFAFWNALASVLWGWALIQRGQLGDGCAAIERALDAMQATGTRFFSAFAYGFLAEGHLRAGAHADGLAAVNAGLTVAETTLNRPYEPELWRLKGELLLRSKVQRPTSGVQLVSRTPQSAARNPQSVEAERCFERGLELARGSKAKSLELRAATSLARAWQARGRTADARKLLGGICKWFGARSSSPDLVEARALLAELENPKAESRSSKHVRNSMAE